jgi:oxygen-dependent protoporphyrinogen oxidase
MRLVVVGGGVTGLAAAHRAAELATERGVALQLLLLEAGERCGGLLRTTRREGFVLEHGPDSMITDRPWGVALARRLGLEGELIGTRGEHRRSFVVRRGRLHPVPEGFQLLAPGRFLPLAASPLFSPAGKLRMALDLVLPPSRAEGDESLGNFVRRRLGREALERVAQPMIAGIYGADPDETSLLATLPRFREMERQHGSVIRGMWARGRAAGVSSAGVSGARYGLFVSFRTGMQTLVEALEGALPEGVVRKRARVTALRRAGSEWRLGVAGPGSPEREVAAEAVVLALPAPACAPLLREAAPVLAEQVGAIPCGGAATVTGCWPCREVSHPLDGFGFVVPRTEGRAILGCTFSHVKYEHRAPEGHALLRAFLPLPPGAEELPDDELEARLTAAGLADLRALLGIRAEPTFTLCWFGRAVMPHYRVGHLERVAEIERLAEQLPGFALAGNAYRGVGIPDSIRSGEQAAERLVGTSASSRPE